MQIISGEVLIKSELASLSIRLYLEAHLYSEIFVYLKLEWLENEGKDEIFHFRV